MKRGKVFGGNVFRDGRQFRAVVYEASQKRAAKVVGVSLNEFRTYWAVTGSEREIAAATEHPGRLVVFRRI